MSDSSVAFNSSTNATKVNSVRLGDIAPNFIADTTHGRINFHDFINGHWCILFSHPSDFTPVCTTELGMVERYKAEFAKRGVKCIALSCDSVEDHHSWIKDIIETQNLSCSSLSFPIIADKSRAISTLYGMLDQTESDKYGLPLTVRKVFIINHCKRIKLTLTYPASTGRNFDELLRVIDSLQLTEYQRVATPANWKAGDDCAILPNVTKEDAKKLFPKGWTEVKPYLRFTPQPDVIYTGGMKSKL